jgi:outer membrane protein assembly factor BamB
VIAFLGGQKGGALTAMDAATGKERWQWTGDVPGYASPIIATFAGTRQLITQSETKVMGVSLADGTLLWQVPLKTPYNQNIVTPLVAGGLLISAGLDNPTIAFRVTSAPGKGWTATPAWQNDQVSMYMSSPAASGSTIFGLSNKNRGQFFAIDAASGKTLWLGKPREADNASIVRAGNFLLLSTTNSELIVARPSATAFEEVKRYTIADSATWAHPAFAGRNIVVKDVDKLIVWSF